MWNFELVKKFMAQKCECGQQRRCEIQKRLTITGNGVTAVPAEAYMKCGKSRKQLLGVKALEQKLSSSRVK